jgi:hypothetical protein
MILLLASLALAPVLIVSAGLIEERFNNTKHVYNACDAVGIARPLDALRRRVFRIVFD